jgi:hypothetical protein
VRSEVLTAVTMKITGFWDVTPCSLIEVYLHFVEYSSVGIATRLRTGRPRTLGSISDRGKIFLSFVNAQTGFGPTQPLIQ